MWARLGVQHTSAGYEKKDPVLGTKVINMFSNLCTLLTELRALGYAAPVQVVNSKPKLAASRRRARNTIVLIIM